MIATHDETRQTLLSLRKREGRGKEGRKEEARRGRGVKGCVNLVSSPIDPLEFRKFRSEGKLFRHRRGRTLFRIQGQRWPGMLTPGKYGTWIFFRVECEESPYKSSRRVTKKERGEGRKGRERGENNEKKTEATE